MLFNYPSFINQTEQDKSRLLYNNIKIALQTSVGEIWYDTKFGTKIREQIKAGISALVIAEIQNDIQNNLLKYFSNSIDIQYLDLLQENNKIKVSLSYKELTTGSFNTVSVEETFINDQSVALN